MESLHRNLVLITFALLIIFCGFAVVPIFLPLHFVPVNAQTFNPVSIVLGASTLGNNAFSPNPINIAAGNTIRWTNNDNLLHTVTSGLGISDADKGKEFDSGLSALTPGKTFDWRFLNPGQFPYFCQLHPAMVGKVIVT